MMRAIRPPESKQATTLLVAVRCRPLTSKEQTKSRDILRVVDDKVVVVLDPDSSKEYLDRVQNRSKEKKYVFDVAFGPECSNKDVYNVTVGSMIEGVLRGLNATVFAYGATGSGKTHTMAGLPEDPGLMVLSLQEIFGLITKQEQEHDFEVTCSYLEVYNEVIYDLLEKSSGHLELREDPDQGITVAGLKRIQVNSAEKILELLNLGNSRRKTESTNANATSSRSHAVLEIIVKRKQRNQYRSQVLRGKLALVDLAGSERASETNNAGQKLRDGANINRSLLALANCINALGKQQKKGLAYVPYRNSKLTRLLKDGLSGNSRTVMVATVSCADDQYHHTTNTLKYADRAKEIKTHIQTNVGTVDAHVADYQRMIDNLQVEVSQLRRELAEKETQLSSRTPEKADDELSWLDVLSHDINENVEMRVNLQKALFELEDMNLHNRMELQQLDELIAQHQDEEGDGEKLDDLIERRQVVLDNIRDNDEAGAHYRQDIEHNEKQRKELQRQIDEAISSNRNKTYLRILSQYRLLGMTNMELQFQMAIRDQIIQDQREALNNMWRLLESSGLNHDQILEIAAQQGIMIEDGMPMSGRSHSSNAPAMHGQPMTPSATRFSNIIQIPRSDGENPKEFRVSSNGSIREPLDTPMSPGTPNMDWRLTESDCIGQANFKAKCLGNSTPLPDVKPQGDTVENSKDLSPEKFREICKQVLLESGVLGRTDTGSDTSCSCSSRLRSQTAHGARKVVTPLKHKRKPRSADCRVRQCTHELLADGNTTGVDAGSEGSETEDSDHCLTSATRHKPSGQQAVDNKMLQRELSRLDNELQDLKRGIERNTSLQAFSSSRGHSAHINSEVARASSRNSSSPFLGNKAGVVHSGDFSRSAPTSGHVPYSHRVSSQNQASFSTIGTPVLDRRQWGKVGSLDVSAAGREVPASKVFLFSSPDLVDGGRSVVNLKSKGLTDRVSPPSRGRQLWPPRNIPEWTA
ncbi:kinesin-like protein KIN-8B [Selaginella moellendorffii]|uniref:kinesin-like protein KIN-8B n=1 Tax=Selaginella moellendorffii TaxID=88036 RepID=UPI000D1C6C49|nr:kinesin-like protein KIN-8B [Selaginella moellendorffii]|eukprot:XP_024544587.1 kinesin-like protein KIN-8B [Selaginella moellendorffii]